MALRELAAVIGVKDDASSVLQGIDTQIDGIKGGLEGTQDELSGLTDETSSFSYEASKDIGEVAGQTGELEEQTSSFGDRMRSVKDAVTQNWTAITAAVGAAGVALEGFARSQQDMIESSERLAYSTGIQADEIRNMAVEMSNATFDLKDAFSLMEIGRQTGLKSEQQLIDYANFWDMVGDASRESSVALADASAGLHAVGIAAGQEEQALSAFGFVHQETRSKVSDFLYMLERTGPELREMGMDINDTAAMLGLMERELGMSGRMARMEFRQAVNAADGDLLTMLDTLGLSESQFVKYRSAVDESGTVIQDLADKFRESRTWAQELQSDISDLTLLYGAEFMPIIEMLSPVMMGAGVVMGILAAGQYLLTGALGKALIPALLGGAKAALGFTAALLTNPITWIIIGVVALGAAIYALWQNWDKVSAWFGEKWDWIKEKAGAVFDWFSSIDLAEVGANIIKGLADGIESGIKWIKDSIKGVGESIVGGVKSFFGIASPSELMMEYGLNLGEGLNIGMEEETKNLFGDMRRMFTPEREQRMAPVAAGAYAPVVNITVNGAGRDADSIANTIDRRLRQTFSTHAERYFSRQRRRR